MLKRGMCGTYEEWLMSAEYIMSEGNKDVILCERGIRTYETYTRNTLDLAAVPAIRELSHLPIIIDPTHGTGKISLIPAHPDFLCVWGLIHKKCHGMKFWLWL